jgi:hypothetical protein
MVTWGRRRTGPSQTRSPGALSGGPPQMPTRPAPVAPPMPSRAKLSLGSGAGAAGGVSDPAQPQSEARGAGARTLLGRSGHQFALRSRRRLDRCARSSKGLGFLGPPPIGFAKAGTRTPSTAAGSAPARRRMSSPPARACATAPPPGTTEVNLPVEFMERLRLRRRRHRIDIRPILPPPPRASPRTSRNRATPPRWR